MPGGATHRIENALDRLRGPSITAETYPEYSPARRMTHYEEDFAHSTTFVITTHFLKTLFGPTMLAVPGAFRNGGLIFSAFAFLALFALVAYNIKRLIIIAAHLSEREGKNVRTYDEVAFVSFDTCTERTKRHATALRLFVNILFFITYLDACTISMIFVARNMEAFVQFHFPDTFLNVRYFLFFQVVPLMAMSTLRDLKYIAPFSFVGCALFLCSVVLTLAFMFETKIPSPLQYDYIGSVRTTLLLLSTVLYCLSGISIALTLKSSMKHPEHFFNHGGVYNVSLAVVCIFFLVFGIVGYSKFGQKTRMSLMLNFPCDSALAVSARIFAVVSVFLTSPIAFYVAFNVLWINYVKPEMSPSNVAFAENFIRFCLITFSFFLAMAIPDLGWMVPLKGAIFHSQLEVTIPAILDYVTFYPEKGNGKFRYRQLKAIFIISCGIFFCVSGIGACLWTLIEGLTI